MNPTTPAIKELARRLIALETRRTPSDKTVGSAMRACGMLRAPLAKFVGMTGYCSLLSRALAMAKAEVPTLGSIQVRPDGYLECSEAVEQNQDAEAGAVVVAQLLGLLVTLIGEPLTLRLVSDVWPDAIQAVTDPFDEGRS